MYFILFNQTTSMSFYFQNINYNWTQKYKVQKKSSKTGARQSNYQRIHRSCQLSFEPFNVCLLYGGPQPQTDKLSANSYQKPYINQGGDWICSITLWTGQAQITQVQPQSLGWILNVCFICHFTFRLYPYWYTYTTFCKGPLSAVYFLRCLTRAFPTISKNKNINENTRLLLNLLLNYLLYAI